MIPNKNYLHFTQLILIFFVNFSLLHYNCLKKKIKCKEKFCHKKKKANIFQVVQKNVKKKIKYSNSQQGAGQEVFLMKNRKVLQRVTYAIGYRNNKKINHI